MRRADKNTVYWIWLSLICRPASRRAVRLLRVFNSAASVFDARPAELLADGVLKTKDRVYSEILRHDLTEAEEVLKWCGKNGVAVLTPESPDYPANLLSLPDAPLVLYVIGTLPDFNRRCTVAVVGTRKMTEYGKRQSFRLGYALGKSGAVLVSGLALGVDGLSMASAIEAGGDVVGVIGSGIDIVYPHEHKYLFKECARHGAIITEYAPGEKPTKSAFPQRNRLISALAQGTVVVEGDRLSGAMITARHAIYQGKDLFAVPGSVDSDTSTGPNDLIREGAYAVTGARDVLERYEFVYPHSLTPALATLCLNGVDAARSAEKTALKYQTCSSGEKGKNYSSNQGSSSRVTASSVVMDTDVPEENYVPSEIPKITPESPAEETQTKKKVGRKKGEKRPAGFAKEQSEPVRIDFEMLSETDMKVYGAMIPDTPMLPDEIVVDGLGAREIMASLTMLEISGAVEAGAAGYFMRTGADDISYQSEE